MSAKHQRHRAGKGAAVTDQVVKIGVCPLCGRAGLVSKDTGRCTGTTDHVNHRGYVRVINRAARCRETTERREARLA